MAHAALVATEVDGRSRGALVELTDADLPEGDVTVAVRYSSLNYKDGLAVTGKGRIVRSFPLVLGVDLAGVVEASDSPDFAPGDEVVLTGWGLSETRHGGYTQRQRVSSAYLVKKPEGMSLLQSMAIGTAGLTSMLCVLALERAGVRPDDGPDDGPADGDGDAAGAEVLVTGAAGGVGSVAVVVLARLGYRVAASTGRAETHDFLRSLGATTLVDRTELATPSGRPLDRERWAGAVDVVGGETLAAILRQTRYGGTVTACGLTGGNDLPTTVLPFILRAVSLVGVESVSCPTELRRVAWSRLARDLPTDLLDSLTTVEPLRRVPELAEDIVAGRTRGRVVIDVNA